MTSRFSSNPKTVEHTTLTKLVVMSRKLRDYDIKLLPSCAVSSKSYCTHILEIVEKECTEELFAELAQLVFEIGNLDAKLFPNYGDVKESALTSYFFRNHQGHNPIIQDTLDMLKIKKSKA